MAYTNYEETITASLYTILYGEFKPVQIVIAENFNESDFKGNNQYIKVWCLSDTWVSDCTNGETRQYEYEVKYFIRDNTKIDRLSLPVNWTNFGEQLTQILNSNKSYAPSSSYKWHSLTIDGSNDPVPVTDENGEIIEGLRSINKTVNITRSNFW